ncbi:MAG: hypothetical protein PHS96_11130, partial [Anaerolineales bacterium]|nr:hypothetical protein [Anaerolineales bacterium]
MPTAARYLRLAILLGMLTAALGAARSGGATALSLSPAWQAKVDPWVLDRAESGETEFLIVLSEQADLSGAASLKTKAEKGAYVYRRLTEVARRTQAPLLHELKRRGVPHRAFWVSNMIWVQGSPTLVQELARRKDVARLSANPHVRL